MTMNFEFQAPYNAPTGREWRLEVHAAEVNAFLVPLHALQHGGLQRFIRVIAWTVSSSR